MKNVLKLNHENCTIVMDRTFAKRSENTRSEEYTHLQQVRQDYPTYTVVRRQIKTNPKKENYKGLTYEYIYERPQLPTSDCPALEKPVLENPMQLNTQGTSTHFPKYVCTQYSRRKS